MLPERDILEAKIRLHQRLYDAGKPEISDADFDALVEMLRRKCPDSPVLDELGKATSLAKIKHATPMLSLEKCYDEKKLRSWLNAVPGPWLVQPKFDGLALSLTYAGGKLVSAATRGDGEVGDDVTACARHVTGIPPTLPIKGHVVIRGEVVMAKETFRREGYADLYANARNLVAGLMQRSTPNVAALKHCSFMIYDVPTAPQASLRERLLSIINITGFGAWLAEVFTEPDAVFRECTDAFPIDYEIDGMVVKADTVSLHQKLGATAHHPRWALAWKFQGESGETEIVNVTWDISRTGTITPVAVVEPIELSGVTITNITLHNLARWRHFRLGSGDVVKVTRRGGVIPHIEEVVSRSSDGRFPMPQQCPACGTLLATNSVTLSCALYATCPGARIEGLLYWCRTVGMLGWGPEAVRACYDAKLVLSPVDFYRLEQSKLAALVGAKTATKLIAEVDKARTMRPEVLLAALGIEDLGLETARKVLSSFLWSSLANPTKDLATELHEVAGVGAARARSIFAGLQKKAALMDELTEHIRIEAEAEANSDGPFAGKKVVFTGALTDMSREAAQALVREAGGQTPASLTKETDILVVGDAARDNQTGKREKALKYGTEVISEVEFARRLAGC